MIHEDRLNRPDRIVISRRKKKRKEFVRRAKTMEKNGELLEIDDEVSHRWRVCIISRGTVSPSIHQSRNGGWRGVTRFFVLRRILINRFVSFRRFAASNPLERFRLHHLSHPKGGEGTIIIDTIHHPRVDFCQSPSSRGHRGRRSCMKAATCPVSLIS